MATTYRRYCDLAGGNDEPAGEVWGAIASVTELIAEVAEEARASVRASFDAISQVADSRA